MNKVEEVIAPIAVQICDSPVAVQLLVQTQSRHKPVSGLRLQSQDELGVDKKKSCSCTRVFREILDHTSNGPSVWSICLALYLLLTHGSTDSDVKYLVTAVLPKSEAAPLTWLFLTSCPHPGPKLTTSLEQKQKAGKEA